MITLLTTKQVKIILIISNLGVIIISVFLWSENQRFLSQKIDNLEKVVVILEPYELGKNRVVYTTERSEVEQIYDLVRETSRLRINKYPQHLESIQWDSDIAIHFEYRNGDKDEFYIKKNGAIVRFLDTRGSSNDPGYIIGLNEKLWEHISCDAER